MTAAQEIEKDLRRILDIIASMMTRIDEWDVVMRREHDKTRALCRAPALGLPVPDEDAPDSVSTGPTAPRSCREERQVDDELPTFLTEQFHRVDQRLDGVDRRLAGVDERLAGVDQRLAPVDQGFVMLGRRFDALDDRFEAQVAHRADTRAAITFSHAEQDR